MTRARTVSRAEGVYVVQVKGEPIIAYTTKEAAEEYAIENGGYVTWVPLLVKLG